MKFARWLNSLTPLDHTVILALFFISCGLAYFTIVLFRNWYQKIHDNNPYTHDIRITPFGLLGIGIFYAIILYRIVGIPLTNLLK